MKRKKLTIAEKSFRRRWKEATKDRVLFAALMTENELREFARHFYMKSRRDILDEMILLGMKHRRAKK